jgi:hypothetical protein
METLPLELTGRNGDRHPLIEGYGNEIALTTPAVASNEQRGLTSDPVQRSPGEYIEPA